MILLNSQPISLLIDRCLSHFHSVPRQIGVPVHWPQATSTPLKQAQVFASLKIHKVNILNYVITVPQSFTRGKQKAPATAGALFFKLKFEALQTG